MAPRAFLELARELVAKPTEASWRTAVSRAYYAIFHVARLKLREWGFQIQQSDQTRVGVARRISKVGIPEWEELARRLTELRSLRNLVDYDLNQPFSQQAAMDGLAEAELAMTTLSGKLSAEERQQAIEAIRQYERDVLRQITWRGT